MTEHAEAPGATAEIAASVSQDIARIQSTELLRGGRELLIGHNGDTYRLRLTSNDKLILTK